MYKTETVKEYILNEIKQGKIKKGQRIPGCREVAQQLSVNKITVNNAFKSLEDMHILYCVPRGGYYFIGADVKDVDTAKNFDFQSVKPDPTLIPYRAFTHAMNRAIEVHKKTLFHYDTPSGFKELRETLKERFEQNGVYTLTSNILITHGAQQGLYLALKVLFPNQSKGKLLVEIPTYNSLLDMAKSLNIACIGIKRNAQGIDLAELKTIFDKEQIKAFYIIPRHHNPTGYSLLETDKKKIVELCHNYQVLLIEDDYLADLGSDKRTLPLHYYDTNHLTFYIKSFSKTFMPGIRLGAMIVPNIFYNSVIEEKYLLDISTSSIPQAALNFFIKSGMYDQHIGKVNACYKRKLFKAKSILTQMSPARLSFHVPKQGLFVWLTLPAEVSVNRVIEKLAQNNIRIGSSSPFFVTNNAEQNLRLCISGIPEADISVLSTVIQVVKDQMQK
ncbi:MAG: PLP-dependent aminotransferase family protein [Syntrophomonas sp.]